MIEDLHRGDRRLVIGQEQHLETVRQLPRLDVELGRRRPPWRRRATGPASRRLPAADRRRRRQQQHSSSRRHGRHRAAANGTRHGEATGSEAGDILWPPTMTHTTREHKIRRMPGTLTDRDHRERRAARESPRRSGAPARRGLAAAVVRRLTRPALSGDLLAGRLHRHRRDDVPGQPLAAGPGRAARPPGRRSGRWARRSSSRPTASPAWAAASTSTRRRRAPTRPT